MEREQKTPQEESGQPAATSPGVLRRVGSSIVGAGSRAVQGIAGLMDLSPTKHQDDKEEFSPVNFYNLTKELSKEGTNISVVERRILRMLKDVNSDQVVEGLNYWGWTGRYTSQNLFEYASFETLQAILTQAAPTLKRLIQNDAGIHERYKGYINASKCTSQQKIALKVTAGVLLPLLTESVKSAPTPYDGAAEDEDPQAEEEEQEGDHDNVSGGKDEEELDRNLAPPPLPPPSSGTPEPDVNDEAEKVNMKIRFKQAVAKHFTRENIVRWIFGIAMAAFVLALVFSPLGPMVFGGLPLVGVALAVAAKWAAASIGGCFAAVGVAAIVGFITWHLDRVLGFFLHQTMELGKGLLILPTLFFNVPARWLVGVLSKAHSILAKVLSVIGTVLLALPALVTGLLSYVFEKARGILHNASIYFQTGFSPEKAKQLPAMQNNQPLGLRPLTREECRAQEGSLFGIFADNAIRSAHQMSFLNGNVWKANSLNEVPTPPAMGR